MGCAGCHLGTGVALAIPCHMTTAWHACRPTGLPRAWQYRGSLK